MSRRCQVRTMRMWPDAHDNGRDQGIVEYGLGIAHYQVGGYDLEGHPGGGFGGECFPFYLASADLSVVISYNLSRKDNPAGKALIQRVLDVVIGQYLASNPKRLARSPNL